MTESFVNIDVLESMPVPTSLEEWAAWIVLYLLKCVIGFVMKGLLVAWRRRRQCRQQAEPLAPPAETEEPKGDYADPSPS